MSRRSARPSDALAQVQRVKARKIPEFHAHGCQTCGERYTDACQTPTVDRACFQCRTGIPRAIWDRNMLPRECCRASALKMTSLREMERYGLGGSVEWWQCPTCKRTIPYDPKELS